MPKSRREYAHEWYLKNKEQYLKKAALYKLLNKEKLKQKNAEWRSRVSKEKREEWTTYSRKFRMQNNQSTRASSKKYLNSHKEVHYHHLAKRRAVAKNATPKWLSKSERGQIYLFYIFSKNLSSATGYVWHVDHIEPLHGTTQSGLHVPWNLQIILSSENLKKKNKFV